ncbi:unnamed protein product [Didymodactylos carnosus]|uniref:Flavin-containing monooxygenase n=1 Tax=Didymodactylos carnosus TaxID=1234261 RepID=A0A8S2HLR0_9BILA|nr:unnamed protein product [Didymodactylos carnosus]CAF3660184.1 unnamed protein product [Didymodactylos carnosus]
MICLLYILRLWSNAGKEIGEFIDYKLNRHFGRRTPSYLPRAAVHDYLVGRVKLGDVRKFIRFRTAVRWVDFGEQQFKVMVEDLTTDIIEHLSFDYVIVASGHYSTPNIPDFDGITQFPGRVLHAHDFRGADEFVGQHVLIIGSSYSAEDIALQLYKYGARAITISYRTRPMRYKWRENIKEVPLLVHMQGRMAHFRDGTTSDAEIDSIIFCTGYRHHHSFMSEHLRLRCPSHLLYPPNLYKGVFWVNQPNLVYLGMQSLVFSFNMFDVQTAFVRDVILSRLILPDVNIRQVDTDQWQVREAKIEVGDEQFDFQTEYVRDLLQQCHSPLLLDVDRINALIHKLKEDKQNNILTYRDQPFRSIFTGERAPIIMDRLPWLKIMDGSLEGFLTRTFVDEDDLKST